MKKLLLIALLLLVIKLALTVGWGEMRPPHGAAMLKILALP